MPRHALIAAIPKQRKLYCLNFVGRVYAESPAVNHIYPSLSAYARNIRSNNPEARRKSFRLFEKVQSQLAIAVGAERIRFIDEDGGPIKIIADAPIEWLPIRGLPMHMRLDCSRINATPGNLMMGQLSDAPIIRARPRAFQKVLVLTGLRPGDPLRKMLAVSIDAMKRDPRNAVRIEHHFVSSRQEFVSALKKFDGMIMVFDGHGHGGSRQEPGTLQIGDDDCDVWTLRNETPFPPIVILSACDTHGLDASNHATVANGMLANGARTVLATLLPVGGTSSTEFVARLVLRLSEFLPAATDWRSLTWTEVISGMQKMFLASEILSKLVGPPSDDPKSARFRLQTQANITINSTPSADWYGELVQGIVAETEQTIDKVRKATAAAVGRSEAIRYVQLGLPETIIVLQKGEGRVAALLQ